jgi:hypothetical protein
MKSMSNFLISESPNILAIAILEMCRVKNGESFCPSEVVKWMYPQSWDYFMDDVLDEMMTLYRKGQIIVTENKIPIPVDSDPKGNLRIESKI